MAQGDRGTLGLVDIATPDVTLGVDRWGLSTGLQKLIEGSSGQVDDTHVSILSQSPMLTIGTKSLKAGLTAIGYAGAQITNADAYLQQLAKYGTREATGVRIRMASGLAVPRRLSASQGAKAMLEYELLGLSADGATAIVTAATGEAIPAGGTVSEAFTLGPVSLNGTDYEVESVDIEFGLVAAAEACSGQVYPTFASVMERHTVLRIGVLDLDAVDAFDASGVWAEAQGVTDSLIYFRQKEAGAGNWADNQSKHVKITCDDGLIEFGGCEPTHGGRTVFNLIYTPIYDGTNLPLVIATDQQIT